MDLLVTGTDGASHIPLSGQMIDHCTNLMMVKGFVDETIDPQIDGLFEEGISSC